MRRALPLLLLLSACGPKAAPSPAAEAPAPTPDLAIDDEVVAGVEDPALRALLQRHWDATMARYPTWATALGDHRFDDRLMDASAAATAAWHADQRRFLQAALELDAASLSEADRLTLRLFIEELGYDVATQVCQDWRWGVSPRWNVYTSMSGLPRDLPVTDEATARALLARYRALPALIDASTENLRAGAADGLVANAASVQLVVDQIGAELDKPVESWPLWKAVTDAQGLEDEALATFTADVRTVLGDQVRPAYGRYVQALQADILPTARGEGAEGLSALPVGEACYGALVRKYTTLPEATADERHQAGLDALEGIHDEFRTIGQRVFGTDDLQEIFERLRTDEALYFETEEQVEDKAVEALARAREAMPDAFGRLPRADCVVERIPAHEAPYTTIAYYMQPTETHPGRYFVNTHAPETRPRHEAEVLAYHESIPGHHLQIAIARELPDVPAFRRHGGMTAFVEGWALYTERLADELGLYSGDVDRLGMLSFDAWRAGRLVVDTGIHARGWSREQAETFLLANTPLAPNNITNEVDRYITTPGQALAYKTGQQEIWRLRRDAEARLGEAFDLRGFHDVVLGAGAVSLPVLRERVEAWVSGLEGGE